MSSRVIRPLSPEPATEDRSTPTSRAKRRTPGPAGTSLPGDRAIGAAGAAFGATGVGAAAGAEGGGVGAAAGGVGSGLGAGGGGAAAAGVGSGAGAAGALEPAAASISMSDWPTLTVSPSPTKTLVTLPAASDGTVAAALSVSTSTILSPAAITSPTETKISKMSAESMSSPRFGSFTSVAISISKMLRESAYQKADECLCESSDKVYR